MKRMADDAVDATSQTDDNGMGNSQPVKGKRSCVCDSFIEIKDENGKGYRGDCKACGKGYKISSRNEISPLLAHLKRCPKKRNVDGEEHYEITAITNPVVSRENMIVQYRYPVTGQTLNYKDLSQSLEKYTHRLQLDGDLRPVILRNYKEEKERLRAYFNAHSFGRFNLSINFFRRSTVVKYCCLALQYIDDAWKPKKKVVAFQKVGFSADYFELSATFTNMLLDWNVHKNGCFITTENTDEADSTVREIKRWLADEDLLPLGGKWSHVNCFLHFLNHLIEDGLQELRVLKWKIFNCGDYVRNKRAKYDDNDLRNAVEDARSEIKKVIPEDGGLSWKIELSYLEKLLSLKNAFDRLKTLDLEFNESTPTVAEWETATRICSLLKDLDDIVQSFKGSSSLTTNSYFPSVCNTYLQLHQWRKDENSRVQSMASKMKIKFDKYWNTSIMGLAIAVILDPRFKFNIVVEWFEHLFGDDAGYQRDKIYSILEEVYNEYASSCDASSAMSNVAYYCDIMVGTLGLPLRPNDVEDGWLKVSELRRYLDEPTETRLKEINILNWWREHEPYFPTLAKMARDFLAVPMSAALSNPSFNDDVKKIHEASIDLDPEIMEHIICLKDWCSTA